nr:TrfA replication initiation protein [uncultured bacterium]
MPDTFDEQEYRRKLIEGGISPRDAADLAARTAAARRESGSVPQEEKPASKQKATRKAGADEAPPRKSGFQKAADLFQLTPPAQPTAAPAGPAKSPAPAPAERRQTVIQSVAQHVSGLADERKGDMAKKPGKTATASLAGTVEQAQEAALLKHTKEQMKSLQLSLFDIAPWPDHMRGMPNDFGRSALFTARNKKTPRAELKDEVIFHVMKDVKITYTGTELRTYDDELVWLQVMEYAKRVPVGEPVTFSLYEFCKSLGWPINGQYYQRIEDSLTRLQTNALKFSSKRVGRLESLSLIRRFGFLDQTEKRKSRCQVYLEEEIVLLFAGEHYAKFVWEKYRKLSGIARRMFDYFSTHKDPYPLSLENFRLMCKSDASTTKKWREQALAAREELQGSGLVKSVWIKDDLVHCER